MVSYAPFWNTLEKKGYTTYTLRNDFGFSGAYIDRISKGTPIELGTIDTLCRILECDIKDIIEYQYDESEDHYEKERQRVVDKKAAHEENKKLKSEKNDKKA